MHLEDIEKMLNDHEARLKKLEGKSMSIPVTEGNNSSPNRQISLPEFVIEKKPQDDLQRTIVFAYYLEKFESQEYFNAEDIQNCFLRAKASKPANINDKINKCVQKALLSEHPQKKDGKKAFYLTATGANLIEAGFEKKE